MSKFKRVRLPVFKLCGDCFESYSISYSSTRGVSVVKSLYSDSDVEAAVAGAFKNNLTTCIVEDEHDNRIRFMYQTTDGSRGFVGYLREVLNENQFVIPKNMSLVESVLVDDVGEIMIKLSLDINPVFNTNTDF